MNVRIVVTGRSYHRAANLPTELSLADDAKLDDALDIINRLLSEEGGLPASCLIAVDGKHVGSISAHQNAPLRENCELTLIAPVAGG
jgi:molybdopterin converting factor small subunit